MHSHLPWAAVAPQDSGVDDTTSADDSGAGGSRSFSYWAIALTFVATLEVGLIALWLRAREASRIDKSDGCHDECLVTGLEELALNIAVFAWPIAATVVALIVWLIVLGVRRLMRRQLAKPD